MRLAYETVSIELTKRCNLECKYCYSRVYKEDETTELTTEQIKSFLINFKASGGRRVLYTGGEALLRKDFKELVLFARELGLLVDLFTNGTLIDEECAQFLSENINLVSVSLDGSRANHDEVRGAKGSYDKIRKALEYLNDKKAHFSLQCMVTSSNYDDLNWLKEVIEKTHPLMIKLGHVSKMGRGRTQKNLWISEDKIVHLKHLAAKISEDYSAFHTRVLTNIITKEELQKFYPTLDNVLSPWLLPNGKIVICYVNEGISDWAISDVACYPEGSDEVYRKAKLLERAIYEEAMKRKYFDLLELSADMAKAIR